MTFINHSLNSLLHLVISALRPLVKAGSLCRPTVVKKLIHQSWLEPPIVIVTADINVNQNAVITLLYYSSNGTKIRTEYRYNTFENLTALMSMLSNGVGARFWASFGTSFIYYSRKWEDYPPSPESGDLSPGRPLLRRLCRQTEPTATLFKDGEKIIVFDWTSV